MTKELIKMGILYQGIGVVIRRTFIRNRRKKIMGRWEILYILVMQDLRVSEDGVMVANKLASLPSSAFIFPV